MRRVLLTDAAAETLTRDIRAEIDRKRRSTYLVNAYAHRRSQRDQENMVKDTAHYSERIKHLEAVLAALEKADTEA